MTHPQVRLVSHMCQMQKQGWQGRIVSQKWSYSAAATFLVIWALLMDRKQYGLTVRKAWGLDSIFQQLVKQVPACNFRVSGTFNMR